VTAVTVPRDGRWRVRHLPALLAFSGVVLVGAAVVGGWARGGVGALGAAVGVALVAASYTASTLVIAWADRVATRLVLPMGLMTYVVKISVLGVVMLVVLNTGWTGMVPMAWGIVAGVVAWSAAQIWWVLRWQRVSTE
jgi:hypothetical protein